MAKKLGLKDVRIPELPQAPYAEGLLDVIREIYKNLQAFEEENGIISTNKGMRFTFDLTDGAKEYLSKENIEKLVEGYNKWCYMTHIWLKMTAMYVQYGQLNIEFE